MADPLQTSESALACLAGAIRRWMLPLLVLLVAAPTTLAQPSEPPMVTIELRYFAFQPNQTAVPVGADVRFLNRQDETHQFVWRDQPLPVVSLAPGGSWDWRFDAPGVYEFRCLYDSTDFERGMRGRIVVVVPPEEDEAPASDEMGRQGHGGNGMARLGLLYGPVLLGLAFVRRMLRDRVANPVAGRPMDDAAVDEKQAPTGSASSFARRLLMVREEVHDDPSSADRADPVGGRTAGPEAAEVSHDAEPVIVEVIESSTKNW